MAPHDNHQGQLFLDKAAVKIQQRLVTDRNGELKQAAFALCDCGNDKFFIFQIEGQHHSHFQCADCGESFCPMGECAKACLKEEMEKEEDEPCESA